MIGWVGLSRKSSSPGGPFCSPLLLRTPDNRLTPFFSHTQLFFIVDNAQGLF